MRFLVLEDSSERVYFLKKLFPNDEISFTDDVDSFLREVAESQFDVVVFDHSLGKQKTGMDAVHAFEPLVAPTLCIVWTNEPSNGIKMVEILRKGSFLQKGGHEAIFLAYGSDGYADSIVYWIDLFKKRVNET